MATVATLSIALTADSRQLRRALQRSTRQVRTYSRNIQRDMRRAFSGVALSAGAATAAIGGITRSVLGSADQIAKAARSAGLTADGYQRLAQAARLAGIQETALVKAVQSTSQAVLRAEFGLQQYTRNFERAGVQWESLRGLAPEEQFRRLAVALSEIEDPAERVAVSINLLGRGGREIGTLLQSIDSLTSAGPRLQALGGVMQADVLERAEKINDELSTLGTVVRSRLTTGIVDGISALTAGLNQAGIDAAIRSAGDAAAKAGAAIAAFGAALNRHLTAIVGAAGALTIFAAATRAIALASAVAGVVSLAAALGRAAAAAASFAVAAAAANLPFAAIALAVAGIAAAVALVAANWDRVVAAARRVVDIAGLGAQTVGAAWNQVVVGMRLTWARLADTIGRVGAAAADIFRDGFAAAANVVIGWINRIGAALESLGGPSISIEPLQGAADREARAESEAVRRLTAEYAAALETQRAARTAFFDAVSTGLSDAVAGVGEAISDTLSAAADLLARGGAAAGEQLYGLFESLGSAIERRLADFGARAEAAMRSAAAGIESSPGFVGPPRAPSPSALIEAGTDGTETATEGIARRFRTSLTSSLSSALARGDFSSIGDALLGSITSTLASVFAEQAISRIFSSAFGGAFGGIFHQGGRVPGPAGADVPILAQAGEYVFTPEQLAALEAGRGGPPSVNVSLTAVGDVTQATRRALRSLGGEIAATVQAESYERRYA